MSPPKLKYLKYTGVVQIQLREAMSLFLRILVGAIIIGQTVSDMLPHQGPRVTTKPKCFTGCYHQQTFCFFQYNTDPNIFGQYFLFWGQVKTHKKYFYSGSVWYQIFEFFFKFISKKVKKNNFFAFLFLFFCLFLTKVNQKNKKAKNLDFFDSKF